ncbi:MAG: hypothetical protein ACR2G2_13340 [Pseudonocardia sp.]
MNEAAWCSVDHGPRRASLLVSAPTGPGTDPLAGARTTLIGDLREVPETDRDAAHRCYRGVHPEAFYAKFADFRLYRLEVAAVRYVGGFGRMSWVGAQTYQVAEADLLHPHADRPARPARALRCRSGARQVTSGMGGPSRSSASMIR